MNKLQNFINNAFVPVAGTETLEIINPADEQVIALAPVSTRVDVDGAYRAASAAFATWGFTTPSERQLALHKIADALATRAEEFADVESLNTGKPRAALVENEILSSADQLRFFAGEARHLSGMATAEYHQDHTSSIRREPVGVVGQVTPWNYPLNMLVWKVAPALAAGCTIVIKPSDTTPLSTLLFAELAAEFLPPGVLNVVIGDRSTGHEVVTHDVPELVAITGSVRAGIEVARSASQDLKKLHLELGGKAPVLVFEDTDIDKTVVAVATGGLYNAGQDCTAATRILVQASIAEQFIDRFVSYIEQSIVTGDPREEGTFLGPVNNINQFNRILDVLEGVPDHARILTGGKRKGDRGFYVKPTVIAGLEQQDELIQNEIFGPVFTVQVFDDEDQALTWANDVKYGLASYLWTKDHGRAMRCSRGLNFGVVGINTTVPTTSEMPHGGFKHSGYGKDLASYGFEEYTRIKHVMSFIGNDQQ